MYYLFNFNLLLHHVTWSKRIVFNYTRPIVLNHSQSNIEGSFYEQPGHHAPNIPPMWTHSLHGELYTPRNLWQETNLFHFSSATETSLKGWLLKNVLRNVNHYTPENQHGTWKTTLLKGKSSSKPSFWVSMSIFQGCRGFQYFKETEDQHLKGFFVSSFGPQNWWPRH